MLKDEYKLENKLKNIENLHEKDPVKFEDLRKEIINTAISSFPEKYRQRAWGIQFTLDCELNKHKNPVVRMNRMIELFWEKFSEFQVTVNDPLNYIAEREGNKKTGKVIPFS